MASLAYRRDESGLVVAERDLSGDEARLSRALKQIDDRLVLQKERHDGPPGWKWRVLRVWSDSHPPTPIVTWTDEFGHPLPLTEGLLDKVRVHMLGFAANRYYVDADEHNRRHVERVEKRLADEHAAIVEEHLPRLSGRTSVSMSGRLRRRRHDPTPDAPLAHERLNR